MPTINEPTALEREQIFLIETRYLARLMIHSMVWNRPPMAPIAKRYRQIISDFEAAQISQPDGRAASRLRRRGSKRGR